MRHSRPAPACRPSRSGGRRTPCRMGTTSTTALTWEQTAMRPEMLPPAPRGMRLQPHALRPLLLGLAWCGLWAGSTALWRTSGPPLLLNLTPSVPRGLYLVTPCPTVTRGMLVVVPPPAAVAALLVARGYLGARTPLLKPVAAVAGDRVCVDEESVVIQGVWRAPVATRDRRGRPLPRWRGCVTLGADEVFLLSTWHAHSFDSRYFGPVGVRQLLGVAAPVVLWDGAAEHHWDAK